MAAKTEPAEIDQPNSIWANDRLGRQEDAAYLRTFLERRIEERGDAGRKRNYVLNLDAGWGHGKTFFLERFASQATNEGHIVAYVNAWRDDFSDDPLVSVMGAIDAAVVPHISKKGALAKTYQTVKENFGGILWAAGKGFAGQLAKKVVGEAAEQIAGMVGDPTSAAQAEKGEKSTTDSAIGEAGESAIREISDRVAKRAIADFSAARQSVDAFREGLEALLAGLAAKESIPMPLYVLVDELDRCRPPFAVAMLERVKHLFEADNVVFIVATNTEQLQHSVSAIYGSGFNAEGYLNRFFDRTYRFAQPDTSAFVSSLVAQFPLDPSRVALEGADLPTFLADTFDQFAVGLRDIEQAYDLLRSLATVWSKKIPIELPAMLPLVIGQVVHVRPRMDDGFIQDLLSTRPPQWRERANIGVKLFDRRNDEFRGRETYVSPADLFSAYRDLTSTPLHKIFEQRPRDPAREYVYSRLQVEFNQLHGNTSYGDKPLSIVRDYPSIVAQAGRLTQ